MAEKGRFRLGWFISYDERKEGPPVDGFPFPAVCPSAREEQTVWQLDGEPIRGLLYPPSRGAEHELQSEPMDPWNYQTGNATQVP